MKTFIKPFWWIPVFLIPQALLFFYEFSIYSIVKTELPEDQHFWALLGGFQGISFLLSLCYIGFASLKKKNIHWVYPVAVLVTEISLLAWFLGHEHDFIPWGIPNWMVDRDEFMLLFVAFTMPALFFSVLQLVSYSIKEENKKQLPLSIVFTLVVPAGWYAYVTLVIPFLYRSQSYEDRKLFEQIVLVIAIVSLVIFFFFLIRTLMLVGRKMVDNNVVRIVMVVLCCLIAPLTGLYINNEGNSWGGGNIFGDFSHWSFYALTVLNAVLLLLPPLPQKGLEKTLIALRFFTLPFSLYFLIVFIPFLPLSVAAMILVGAGILLLAPVLNFIIHVYRLAQDLKNTTLFPRPASRWWIALPVFLLPVAVHCNYLLDRNDLRNALAWIYTPDYRERSTEVDPKRISYVLDVVTSAGRNRGMFQGRRFWKPYLSSYYRWLVLDNLTLSGKKISDLEQTFVGTNFYRFTDNTVAPPSSEVIVRSVRTETTTDPSGSFYKTLVHLELENQSGQQQEFIGRLSLPEGAWISDYYLDIGTKREHGILAEKRTAQWVYRNIVNRRRDPGIISYLNGNELELRVFPLEAQEKRRTGWEIVHTGPLQLPFAGTVVSVEKPPLLSVTGVSVKMVTGEEKTRLPLVVRKKKYYFLIDNSTAVSNPEEKKKVLDRVQNDLNVLSAEGPIQLFSVHHSAHELGLKAWRPLAEQRLPEGGFFAERVMKTILIEHYQQAPELVPVFLLYSNQSMMVQKNFMDLSFAFPDVDRYFVSGPERAYPGWYNTTTLNTSSDSSNEVSAAKLAVSYRPEQVRLWKDPSGKKFFLPSQENSMVLLEEKYTDLSKDDALWKKAATQQGNTRFLQLHPELSEKHWRSLVAQNFETGIVSPYTSYLVVETEAQKEVLRQKQKEVLNAAQYFDIEQEFISMAEPSWWWYLLIPVVLIGIKKYRPSSLPFSF